MARGTKKSFLLFCRIQLALALSLLALGCASAEEVPGAAGFSEQVPGTAQQALLCLCGTCTPTTCADVVCGTARDCCIPRPKNDGAKCGSGATLGTCAGGECCVGCIETLKDGSRACHPGVQPEACGVPGGSCTNCNDNNPCTEDGCDPRGSCTYATLADNAACPSGVCWGGACCRGCIDARGLCQPGNLPDACGVGGGQCAPCGDDDICTDDVCNAGGCENPVRPNGVSCETDNNVCNGTNTCQTGTCTASAGLECNDGNPCTNDMCDVVQGCKYANNTLGCSDGNPCTSGDACSEGSCKAGPAVVCNDNEACTTDVCTEQSGCVYTPRANGITCDDNSTCTAVSSCASGKCVGGPGQLICDDQNPCTLNNCGAVNGANACNYATFAPLNSPCVQNKCFVNTVCDGLGVCGGGAEKDCDDKNPCTNDECNVATGACVNPPKTGGCSDGSLCTLNDSCRAGTCTGDAVECATLDDCHVSGSCNAITGLCDDPRAEDGTACAADTGTCTAGRCVTTPIPPEGGAGGTGPTAEGGAEDSGAGDSGDAGAGASNGGTSARGGSGASLGGVAGQGARGGIDAERGPPFSREPGGCACSLPREDSSSNALLFFAASALGLACARRKQRASRA